MANAVQQIVFAPLPASGTYTLTYSSDSPVTFNWNDDAATIQSGMEGSPSIGSGNITVSGEADTGTITLSFVGGLAQTAVPLVAVDASGLSAAGTIGAVTETTPGVAAVGDTSIWKFSGNDAELDGLNLYLVQYGSSPVQTTYCTFYTVGGSNDPGNGGNGNCALDGNVADDAAALARFLNADPTANQFISCAASGPNMVATSIISPVGNGNGSSLGWSGTATEAAPYFALNNSDNELSFDQTGTDGTAEVQQIPAPNATGGSYTVDDGSFTNAEVSFPDPGGSNLQTAIGTLPAWSAAGGATVVDQSGTGVGPFVVTWNISGPQGLLTVNGMGLTGGPVTATSSTTQDGSATAPGMFSLSSLQLMFFFP